MLEQIIKQSFPIDINYPIIFGLFMVLGVLAGLVTSRLRWIPAVSGFIFIGLAMGPEGLGLINKSILIQASSLVQIALGLILFKLGASLHPGLIARDPKILLVSLGESAATFIVCALILFVAGFSPLVCILVSAIAISSSPAVLVHVASETGARGTVTDMTEIMVALNNLISFMIFSAALPFGILYSDHAALRDIIGVPLYRMGGGLAVGAGVALLLCVLARFIRPASAHLTFPLILGGIMLTLGLTLSMHTSFLLACLILGVAVRWWEHEDGLMTKAQFGYAEDIFFIILFVTAGASLHLGDVVTVGWIALILPLGRCVAKYLAIVTARAHLMLNVRQSTAMSMLLMPMAGMAIGLVQTTSSLIPYISEDISAIVFAAVVILETLGPPVAKSAFFLAGEAHMDTGDGDEDGPAPGQKPARNAA